MFSCDLGFEWSECLIKIEYKSDTRYGRKVSDYIIHTYIWVLIDSLFYGSFPMPFVGIAHCAGAVWTA